MSEKGLLMGYRKTVVIISTVSFITGCATVLPPSSSQKQSPDQEESVSALRSVGEAVSGRSLSEEELRDVARQIQSDPQARDAVETITENLTGAKRKVKYCPVCGKRFSPHLTICPEHQVELKEIED